LQEGLNARDPGQTVGNCESTGCQYFESDNPKGDPVEHQPIIAALQNTEMAEQTYCSGKMFFQHYALHGKEHIASRESSASIHKWKWI